MAFGQLATYSGMDTTGAFQHPLIAPIPISGIAKKGLAQATVRMAVTQTTMQVAMDGAVVPSAIPGDNGEIEIQVWQTSTLHRLFLAWYNALKTARDLGDVSNWADATILLQNTVDGSSHYATGVAPMKVPDKSYAEAAARVSWVFMCAQIINQ